MMGEQPTSLEACVYAFLANLFKSPVESPLSDYVKAQASFVEYVRRMDTTTA
jgi:hypothetical protein